MYRLARHSSLSEGFKLRPNLSPKERVTKKFESGAKKLLGKVVHRTGPNILLLTQNGTSLNNMPTSTRQTAHFDIESFVLSAQVSVNNKRSPQQRKKETRVKENVVGGQIWSNCDCLSSVLQYVHMNVFGLFHSVISNSRYYYSIEYSMSAGHDPKKVLLDKKI